MIRFACRERAEEIEESAYRNGFVCHEHATCVEDAEGEEGFTFGEDGEQHCVGVLLMNLMDGGGNVPFEWLPEDEQDRIQSRLEFKDGTFYENATDFLDSYGERVDDDD